MKRKNLLRFAEELYCRFEDDGVTALGAQMTYYFILAFFPFLIFLLTLVGYTALTAEEVLLNMSGFLPETSYALVSDILTNIMKNRNNTLLSVGAVTTLWASSSGLTSIIIGLNKAYDVEETRPWWKLKGMSLLFTLAMAVLLVFSMSLLVFGHVLGEHVFRQLNDPDYFETVWATVKYLIPACSMVVVFILLYRFTPNRRVTVRSVIPGAVCASAGWIVISLLFSLYVNNFNNYSHTYGSIGGIIVLLIWLYLNSIILLAGGEINAILTCEREGKSKPHCKPFSKRLFFWKKAEAS